MENDTADQFLIPSSILRDILILSKELVSDTSDTSLERLLTLVKSCQELYLLNSLKTAENIDLICGVFNKVGVSSNKIVSIILVVFKMFKTSVQIDLMRKSNQFQILGGALIENNHLQIFEKNPDLLFPLFTQSKKFINEDTLGLIESMRQSIDLKKLNLSMMHSILKRIIDLSDESLDGLFIQLAVTFKHEFDYPEYIRKPNIRLKYRIILLSNCKSTEDTNNLLGRELNLAITFCSRTDKDRVRGIKNLTEVCRFIPSLNNADVETILHSFFDVSPGRRSFEIEEQACLQALNFVIMYRNDIDTIVSFKRLVFSVLSYENKATYSSAQRVVALSLIPPYFDVKNIHFDFLLSYIDESNPVQERKAMLEHVLPGLFPHASNASKVYLVNAYCGVLFSYEKELRYTAKRVLLASDILQNDIFQSLLLDALNTVMCLSVDPMNKSCLDAFHSIFCLKLAGEVLALEGDYKIRDFMLSFVINCLMLPHPKVKSLASQILLQEYKIEQTLFESEAVQEVCSNIIKSHLILGKSALMEFDTHVLNSLFVADELLVSPYKLWQRQCSFALQYLHFGPDKKEYMKFIIKELFFNSIDPRCVRTYLKCLKQLVSQEMQYVLENIPQTPDPFLLSFLNEIKYIDITPLIETTVLDIVKRVLNMDLTSLEWPRSAWVELCSLLFFSFEKMLIPANNNGYNCWKYCYKASQAVECLVNVESFFSRCKKDFLKTMDVTFILGLFEDTLSVTDKLLRNSLKEVIVILFPFHRSQLFSCLLHAIKKSSSFEEELRALHAFLVILNLSLQQDQEIQLLPFLLSESNIIRKQSQQYFSGSVLEAKFEDTEKNDAESLVKMANNVSLVLVSLKQKYSEKIYGKVAKALLQQDLELYEILVRLEIVKSLKLSDTTKRYVKSFIETYLRKPLIPFQQKLVLAFLAKSMEGH